MSHADTQKDIDEMDELNDWLDSLPTSWTTLEGLKRAIEEREEESDSVHLTAFHSLRGIR